MCDTDTDTDTDTISRRRTTRPGADCRVQLLVNPPLQFYLVRRTLALCASAAIVTALAYVGVDCYVHDRWPGALSLVPLLIAVVVALPPIGCTPW